MAFLLSFQEIADCFGLSLDAATRIIERDLPIVELHGRGERPMRRVDVEAVEAYIEYASKFDSDLARKIQAQVVEARTRRIEAAIRAREDERAAALPEIVRATRKALRDKTAKAKPVATSTEEVSS